MKAYNLDTARQHQDRVTELYLHGLGITEWPSFVFELPQLQVLCLSDNRLKEVPSDIIRLARLRTLDLSGNLLQSLPLSLPGLSALQEVNLSGNQFSRFPTVLGKMPGLQRIDLGSNKLRTLPLHMDNLSGLAALRLDRNQLRELPAWIGGQTGLRELKVAENKLKEIPGWICGLELLSMLNLERNKLTALPWKIGDLTGLAELNVRRNELESIPESIGKLHGLRRLLLDDNRIAVLPPSMEKLHALRLLSCQGNRIGEWPGFLGQLPRLEELELGHNLLQSLPEEAGKWPALERLGLQSNALCCFPESFCRLPRLKELHLGRNQVTRFPEPLISAPVLEKVSGVPGTSRAMRFLQACRQSEAPEASRKELFRLWQGEIEPKGLSAEALREGLRLPLPSLRKSILSQLVQQTRTPIDPLRSVFSFLGKTRLSRSEWKDRLDKAHLKFQESSGKTPTHAVLGAGSLEVPAGWLKKGVAFMEESALFQELRDRAQEYLQGMDDPASLGRLLQSGQEASLRLSLSLMKSGGVPPALMTDLYLAWRSAGDTRLKKELRDLLLLHASAPGTRMLEQVKTIKSPEQITQACVDSEFDPARIWQWWESSSRKA